MNKKSLITNICLASVGVLALIFLALPYLFASGYETLSVLGALAGAEIAEALVFIAPLFFLLSAIALIVFAGLGILCDTKVIKSEKLLKAVRIVNLVASIVFTLFALVAFLIIVILGAPFSIGLILNLLAAIGAIVVASLAFAWGRK